MLKKITFLTLCVAFVLSAGTGFCLDLDKLKSDYLRGDYKAAIIEGERMLANSRISSHSDELYYFLGLSYSRDGNYLRASDIFEIIINEFQGSSLKNEAILGLGDTYFLRGDYRKAGEYYRRLLDDNRLKPAVYYRLSQCAIKEGDVQEGRVYAEKLKTEFPLNPESKFNRELYPVNDFFSVQVGSFSNPVNANNLRDKLSARGYDAYIQEAEADAKKSYRVRVGKLKSRSEASLLEGKLSSEGYPTKITP